VSTIGAVAVAGVASARRQPATLTLAAPSRAIARLAIGARIDGQVLPGGAAHAVVLQTPQGVLPLTGAGAGALPPGTGLTLEVRSVGDAIRFAVLSVQPRTVGAAPGTAPQPVQGNSPSPLDTVPATRAETALSSLMAQLSTAGGGQAVTGGTTGGTGALLYLLGLRGASTRAWLGAEGAAALERTGRLEGAERTLAGLREQTGRAEADGWRFFPLPLIAQGEGRMARLWIRPDPPGERGAATRLLLELDLPLMGLLRFEGFLLGSRFDLVLVTENPLPEPAVRTLPHIFAGARARVGLEGRFSTTLAANALVSRGPGLADGILA
jgi:hypothetical protein